jgi:hypothetical protein
MSILLVTYYAVRFRNFTRENQRLIDEIDRKHKQLETTARQCKPNETMLQMDILSCLGLRVIRQLDQFNRKFMLHVNERVLNLE